MGARNLPSLGEGVADAETGEQGGSITARRQANPARVGYFSIFISLALSF